MPTIVVQTPNVTKTYTLDAAHVTQLIDYAAAKMENGGAATALEKEAWLAHICEL